MAESSKLVNAAPHATLAGSGGVLHSSNMVGMVISGRAAKACDVCGKERARWYCATDLAYLCEHCDKSVHSANAVAGRHERARLGPNGMPVKVASVNVKQDAALSPHSPCAQFNPRKRPRSIRRHKPRSFHASEHVMSSSTNASNHLYGSSQFASNYSIETGSILASTHGVMINNPRNNPDFIANINSNELSNKAFVVKSEPYSPVDIGDQVKVPDHVDDDHILESLFAFRDLQDDDLFLHQVPIYNPPKNQVDLLSPPPRREQYIAEEEEAEEKKPIINLTPASASTSENSNCANAQFSPDLHQAEDSKGLPLGPSAQGLESPSFAEDSEADQSTDNDICDLDQLDFDCVLQGDGEDGDDMGHATMEIDINLDIYADHATSEANAYGEVRYDNGTMDDAAGQCDGDHQPNYATGFDFDAKGSESPRTWLCKVKVESPPELGIVHGQHSTELYDDALLREKLTCKTLSAESQHTFKLGLKLNFEDILSSWSDKGSFWMDGHGPSQVGNCLDFLGGCFVPDVSGTHGTEGPEGLLVPVLNHKNMRSDGGAREASVLRYREKRRTRLFSKKIRYEVRKLNAEKRPRMKGRFVKRIVSI